MGAARGLRSPRRRRSLAVTQAPLLSVIPPAAAHITGCAVRHNELLTCGMWHYLVIIMSPGITAELSKYVSCLKMLY